MTLGVSLMPIARIYRFVLFAAAREAGTRRSYSFYGDYHTYGIDNYDRANLDALSRKINPGPFKSQNQACEGFMTNFYYDGNNATSCSRSKACALNNISSAAYGQCNP